MNAIFASKLFQDSERKEDIKSALKNPMNKELVQQLSDYLDEPVEEESEKKEEKKSNMNIKHTTRQSSDKESSNTEQPRKSNMNISRSSKTSPLTGKPQMEEPEEPSTEPAEDMNNDTVEESSCTGKTYKKSRSSIKSSIFYVPSFSVDTLIGTLQSNESTANVDRIRLKEDRELWIFYNDSVNLNDIMNDVIELINAAGYSHLEFNRLARSDNAIVFELTPESIPMQPTESESEEPEIEGVEIGEKTEE